jgi:hypothetical protein
MIDLCVRLDKSFARFEQEKPHSGNSVRVGPLARLSMGARKVLSFDNRPQEARRPDDSKTLRVISVFFLVLPVAGLFTGYFWKMPAVAIFQALFSDLFRASHIGSKARVLDLTKHLDSLRPEHAW